jgi:hypothetical protein
MCSIWLSMRKTDMDAYFNFFFKKWVGCWLWVLLKKIGMDAAYILYIKRLSLSLRSRFSCFKVARAKQNPFTQNLSCNMLYDTKYCWHRAKRRQFHIRLAFSMNINKPHGQTFDKVCLYLPKPVFNHGQLYVAVSRVWSLGSPSVVSEMNGIANCVYNKIYE